MDKMESDMDTIKSVNLSLPWNSEIDFNVDECWKTIEPVARTILKDQTKPDLSSWRQAIRSVFELSRYVEYKKLEEKFHPMIQSIINDHVKVINQKLSHENLLENYCIAWRNYKMDSENFQMLFLHFNNWILSQNKIDPNLMMMSSYKKKLPDLEDMTNSAWKKHMLEPIGLEITSLLWNAITNEENVQEVAQSFEQVDAVDIIEKTFFEKLREHYKSKSIDWFQGLSAAEFIEKVLQKMEEEVVWCQTFLPQRSIDMMKTIFIGTATAEHMDEMMMMECQQMLKENRKDELKKLYKILRLLPAESKGNDLLSTALQITVRNEALDSSCTNMKEFQANLLSIYRKYRAMIEEILYHDCKCLITLQKVLEYKENQDCCDGMKMLEKYIKELSNSGNSVAESAVNASEIKDLLVKLKLIFKKLNLPFTLQMDGPNFKRVILHQDEELEQKKRRLDDSPEIKNQHECSTA
ncbi:Hypothetical predicted protein [Cloeon dipterum]|uniref:Cullin N-terminal domain-containing protein n=1 Tax=Cloeon dipterum TaxID=197152 RepID=A0A8S1DJN4_9INSE|nr:Hypothetical predicted protein [Cloeon dipterum]